MVCVFKWEVLVYQASQHFNAFVGVDKETASLFVCNLHFVPSSVYYSEGLAVRDANEVSVFEGLGGGGVLLHGVCFCLFDVSKIQLFFHSPNLSAIFFAKKKPPDISEGFQ